jgi:hypothetical protein
MKHNWRNIRIGILLTIGIMQLYIYFNGQTVIEPSIDTKNIVLTNISIFFILPIFIIIERFFFRNKLDKIQKINWSSTLFTFEQPIQFFNYSGWMLFTAFLLPTIHSFIVESKYFLDNILLLSVGMTVMGTTYLIDSLVGKYKLKRTK